MGRRGQIAGHYVHGLGMLTVPLESSATADAVAAMSTDGVDFGDRLNAGHARA
jgi:hypothetical protein